MEFFTNRRTMQKIIILIITVILCNFILPICSYADEPDQHADSKNETSSDSQTSEDDEDSGTWFGSIGGDLLKELVQLVASVGDVVMGAMNKFMLGTSKIIGSTMLSKNDINLKNANSSLYNDGNADVKKTVKDTELNGLLWTDWKIPNFLYSPEAIFSNQIAMLDVNFISKHKYTAVEYKKDTVESDNDEHILDDDYNGTSNLTNSDATSSSRKRAQSSTTAVRETIASWYQAFRNIAVVGLLIVLVYLGIRILITTTAVDKAKYKESIYDWLVALCLVIIIHFIMSGIMMFTDKFTDLFYSSVNRTISVTVTGGEDDVSFKTNMMGYIRFMSQNDDWGDCTAYSIMYLTLVIYTLMFTVTYFKRFLYMAFFTMIAPLVAITYPIDKIKDGKAQAFDMWFKEYTMNAIIQPVHLILYSVFIGSAIDLAVGNPIYGIVAMGFLLPAEKFIKKMFGLDKGETASGLGTIAGGALAMKGVGSLVGHLKGGSKDKGNGGTTPAAGGESRGKTPGVRMHDPIETITGGTQAREQAGAQEETQEGGPAGAQEGTRPRVQVNVTNSRFQQNQNEEQEQRRDTENPPMLGNGLQEEQEEDTDTIMGPDGITPAREWIRQREKANMMNRQNTEQDPLEETIDGENGRTIEQTGEDVRLGLNGQQNGALGMGDNINGDTENGVDGEGQGQTIDSSRFRGTSVNPEGERAPSRTGESENRIDVNKPNRPLGTFVNKVATSKVGRGLGAVAGYEGRKIRGAMSGENIKNKAFKATKGVAKKALKLGATAAGTVAAGAAIGTIGAAAAVSSGDLSKGASIMAGAAGMSASLGSRMGGKVSDSVVKEAGTVRDTFNSGYYTADERKKKKQARLDKEWKQNAENYKYLMEKHGMTNAQARDFLNDDRVQAFRDRGIEDVGIIKNAIQYEEDHNGATYDNERAIAMAEMAQDLGSDFKKNASSQNAFAENLRNKGYDQPIINEMIQRMKTVTDV